MTPVIRALCVLAMPLTAVAAEQIEDSMMTQVQSMIADVVAQKRALNPSEDSAIQLMVTTLNETTIPSIYRGHRDEQTIVTAAYDMLVGCNTKLTKNEKSAEHYATNSSEKHLIKETCRGDESGLADARAKAYEALRSFVEKLGSEPSKPSGIVGLTPWLQQSLEWFKDNKKLYAEKKNASLSANATWSSKKEECDKAAAHFESASCIWYEFSSDSIEHYKRCWEAGTEVFKTVISAGEDSVLQRTSEYVSSNKLLCYVAILSELQSSQKVPDDIDQRMDHCKNLEPDTDWLVLNDTEPPAKHEPSFSMQLGGESVILPGGVIPGVTCGEEPVEGTPATTSTTTSAKA